MLQRDQDGDHDGLRLRLVDIDAVLVVDGEHLLTDDGDNLSPLVIELEVQSGDVALQLPAKALDVRDVPDQVPQLV